MNPNNDNNGTAPAKKKFSLGRQRIEMKRIEKAEKRQVCFSKRRTGLFNKARDLSVLCGAHIGVLVFSPAGKPYSFGSPSVDAVLDRYLSATGNINITNVESMGLEELERVKAELEALRLALTAASVTVPPLRASVPDRAVVSGSCKDIKPNLDAVLDSDRAVVSGSCRDMPNLESAGRFC